MGRACYAARPTPGAPFAPSGVSLRSTSSSPAAFPCCASSFTLRLRGRRLPCDTRSLRCRVTHVRRRPLRLITQSEDDNTATPPPLSLRYTTCAGSVRFAPRSSAPCSLRVPPFRSPTRNAPAECSRMLPPAVPTAAFSTTLRTQHFERLPRYLAPQQREAALSRTLLRSHRSP